MLIFLRSLVKYQEYQNGRRELEKGWKYSHEWAHTCSRFQQIQAIIKGWNWKMHTFLLPVWVKQKNRINDVIMRYRTVHEVFEFHWKFSSTEQIINAKKKMFYCNGKIGVVTSEECGEENHQSSKLSKPNPCIGCLGLLQKPYCDGIIDSIISGVNIAEYDAETFNVSFKFPSCYLIRTESLLTNLRNQFPAFYEQHFRNHPLINLKDCFKAAFGQQLADNFNLTLNVTSGFLIDVEFKYDDDIKECKPLSLLRPDDFTNAYVKRSGYSKNKIESVLENVTDSEFANVFDVPPAVPSTIIKIVKTSLTREPTNIAGRYNKYCRNLPQTPWLLNGERKMESSVEEIISEPLVQILSGISSKFASSGREDVDVRNLGRGRPFNVEVSMPKRASLTFKELRDLEKKINENSQGKLNVRDLQVVSRESLANLKQGEEEKSKTYTALCICPNGIPDSTLQEAMKNTPLTLAQSTPIRVLHRRPVGVRQKTIMEMSAQRINGDDKKFILKLNTQAGTYIKEFVHGDFGRTKPSLGDLIGTEVDILALDVTDIALDWPPSVDYSNFPTNGIQNTPATAEIDA